MTNHLTDGPSRPWWRDWRNRAMVLAALLLPSAGTGYIVAKVQDTHEQTILLAADQRREDAKFNTLSAQITTLQHDIGELERHLPGECVCTETVGRKPTTVRIGTAEACDAKAIAKWEGILHGFTCKPST